MRLCECDICKDLTGRRPYDTGDALEDTDCIVVTTMTITSIVRLVPGLEIGDMVKPTIAGLQQFYRQCLRRMELSWRQNEEPSTIADALDLLLKQDDLSNSRQRFLTPANLMVDV